MDLPGGATLLACVDYDRLLWRWDPATGERVGEPVPLGGDEDTPWLTPAPVGGAARLFVAGTADGTAWGWDPIASRRARNQLRRPHPGRGRRRARGRLGGGDIALYG